MVLSYDVIVSEFLQSIDDVKFLSLSESDAVEFMNAWMKSALSEPYVRRLFSSVKMDDEIRVLNYEMKRPVNDEEDADFVTKVIAKGMHVAWLQPQVASTKNVHQAYGGKEEKLKRHFMSYSSLH